MFQKIHELVQLLNREYLQTFSISTETRTQDLQDILRFLKERCQTENTVFVHGRGKRNEREGLVGPRIGNGDRMFGILARADVEVGHGIAVVVGRKPAGSARSYSDAPS